MAKKYYAVQKGRHPGIYTSWPMCQAQVQGFSGAIYKSFTTLQEATDFFEGKESSSRSSRGMVDKEGQSAIQNPCDIVAYIDGSFDKHKGVIGYGGLIFFAGQQIPFSFGTKDQDLLPYWNVAGELQAAMYVMDFAKSQGAKSCAIYYDYNGIEMWASGKWRANNELTKKYVKFVSHIKESLSLEFHKVAAHQGDKYNEIVDALAKEGLEKA